MTQVVTPPPPPERTLRVLTATADPTAEIRHAEYRGAPHLVIPVVALIGDSVYRPLGSRGPEFVPLSELQVAPSSWNGRPVVAGHPDDVATANTPETLEALSFGMVFAARVEDGRLKMEAWLDAARARALGGDAADAVARIEAGEMVEVSVGAMTLLERVDGRAPDGTAYEYRWRGVFPDHVAALARDTVGACSIDQGCGLLRAAEAAEDAMTVDPVTPLNRLLGALRGLVVRDAALDTTSDNELRQLLDRALFASEPGFAGIADVFPEESMVVYWRADADMNHKAFRARYAIGEDDSITFSRRTAVQPVTKYEPMQAEPTTDEPTNAAPTPDGCACSPSAVPPSAGNAAPLTLSEGGSTMSTKQELVGRLIECDKQPFTDADRAALEAMSEATLTALASAGDDGIDIAPVAPTPPPVAAANPSPDATPDAPRQISESDLPAELQRGLSRLRAFEAAERKSLTAAIKSHPTAATLYTDAQLAAFSLDDLAERARLLGLASASTPTSAPIDFSLRFAARSDDAAPTDPPKPYTLALAKLADARKSA